MTSVVKRKPRARNSRGQFLPKSKPKLKNHFVLVCDGSGSMRVHAEGAARLFNEQLDTIQDARDQENTVTVFDFGASRDGSDVAINEVRYNVPPRMVARLNRSTYPTVGNTPLYDAVVKAGERAMCDEDGEKSFVMVVLTDGEENASKKINASKLQTFIKEQQATDRWTFVFLVPRGYKRQFVRESGVHEGNVREWENIESAREQLTCGTQSYFALRSAGFTSTKDWFTTDLSGVTSYDLSKLQDVTSDIELWTVEREAKISEFVDNKSGDRFAAGRSFFEIMKKERQFQDYKKLLIMDKATKRIYADGVMSVRSICGLPAHGDIAIDPGNHANFILFGQSFSTNRILPRGTRLVFWEQAG